MSAATGVAARRAAGAPFMRVFEHNWLNFRRTWRGYTFTSIVSPILFLTAMGLGLGPLVDRASGGVNGVPYLDFLAPGLLVTTAMQAGAGEMTYPILGKIMWNRIYEAMLSTRLRVADVLVGELAWTTFRLSSVSLLFFVVMTFFGIPRASYSFLCVFAGILTGLAFATPVMAFTATRRRDSGFAALNRFVINPLFLFGGAFFPITKLPFFLQVVAWLTPLYHGVDLSRGLTRGTITPAAAAVDVAVLLAYVVGGVLLAVRNLQARLVE